MIESFAFLIEWQFACKLERGYGRPFLHFLDALMTWGDIAEMVVVRHGG